jgi:hypothetical protein
MAGLGIALRGLGKALKKISKNKKVQDNTGLFSTGAVTGIVLNEATSKKQKSSKTPTGMRMSKKKYPKYGVK